MKKNTTCPNCKCDEIYESGPKTMTCEVCGESWKKEREFFISTTITTDKDNMKESFLEDETELDEPIFDTNYDEENIGYED